MTAFLNPDDLPVIQKLAASDGNETIQKRGRLLLLYEAGKKTAEIAEEVDLSPGRVLYWRRQYLKDGLGVFGDALDGLEKVKEKKKRVKEKKGESPSLASLTRAARKAEKSDDDSAEGEADALAAGIKRAEKQRKKLKKRQRRASKKQTAKIKDRLKKLNRRIKKAKKTLKKLD